MQWKEPWTSLFSLFHLVSPNPLHPRGLLESSWAGFWDKELQWLLNYWTPLWECYLLKYCKKKHSDAICFKRRQCLIIFHFIYAKVDVFCSIIHIKKSSEVRAENALHDALGIPYNWVRVKLKRWIEPQAEFLLPIPLSLGIHISMQSIRVPTLVTQELEVNLVMLVSLRC